MKGSRAARRVTTVVAALALALTAGVAFAAWTADGSGSGSAKATTAQSLTIETVAIVTGDIYPGGKGDVTLKVTNPNPYDVQITTIELDGAITADDAGCNVSSLSFEDQTGLSGSDYLVSANGNKTITLDDKLSMDNTVNDDCQGATFTIPLTLTGNSSVA